MNEDHRKILRQKREIFLKDLDARKAASMLYARDIFSEDDKDEVNAMKTAYQQREKVLDILPRKGPKAFQVFCDILHEISPHLEVELRPVQEEGKAVEITDGSLDKKPLPSGQTPTGESSIQNPSVGNDLDVDGLFKCASYDLNKTSKQLNTTTMYKMTSTPRGIAVIISNKNFLESSGQHFSPREGTEVDREALKRLFKMLQFKVEIYNDQTTAEMRRVAVEKAAFDHSKYDAFIFAILTHGQEGVVYGIDGTISIRDITSLFTQCKSLAGKPKMFFFQACQGNEFMDGLDVLDGPYRFATDKVSVPVEADFLYAYSTVPGYYAWRSSTEGSWFIKSIVKVFEKNAYNMEILQMLTRVNNLISTYKSRHSIAPDKRQVSSTVSMLTKDLYFFPPTK